MFITMKKLVIAIIALLTLGLVSYAYRFTSNDKELYFCPKCAKPILKSVSSDTTQFYYWCPYCGCPVSDTDSLVSKTPADTSTLQIQ